MLEFFVVKNDENAENKKNGNKNKDAVIPFCNLIGGATIHLVAAPGRPAP